MVPYRTWSQSPSFLNSAEWPRSLRSSRRRCHWRLNRQEASLTCHTSFKCELSWARLRNLTKNVGRFRRTNFATKIWNRCHTLTCSRATISNSSSNISSCLNNSTNTRVHNASIRKSINMTTCQPNTTSRKRMSILVSSATLEKRNRGSDTTSKTTLIATTRTKHINRVKRRTSSKDRWSYKSRRLQNKRLMKNISSTKWAYSRVIAKEA